MRKYNLFKIIVVLLLFSACAPRQVLAPVDDRAAPPSTKVSTHVVASGETLYAIAWRYNLSYESLAKANGIGRSYRIYPGQILSLKAAKKGQANLGSSRKGAAPQLRKDTASQSKVGVNSQHNRLKNKTTGPVSTASGHVKLPWQWPFKGKILRSFSGENGLNKGIDIGGELGEPVLAASSGTVVYAGDGLRGYGKLIIIKHSDDFLSAYAHNRKLQVKEGDVVAMGEKVAELGRSGTNTVKLHFEIRLDGQPVDPLKYLPPN